MVVWESEVVSNFVLLEVGGDGVGLLQCHRGVG